MDPLELGVVHQAMPQGIIDNGAQTVEQFNWEQTDLKRTTEARHTCDWER